MERGPYTIAAVMDESSSKEPLETVTVYRFIRQRPAGTDRETD